MATEHEIATGYINIKPKVDGGFEGELSSQMNSSGGSAGGFFGSSFAVAAGNLISGAVSSIAGKAVDVAKDVMGQAFENFGNYEQLSGGVEKIFDQGDISGIMSDAQNAYKDLNMSANEYLESINQVGATFAQTMGDQKGYDTARSGMKAISDYASGTGRSLDELNEKYVMITRASSSYQSIADQFSGILPATSAAFLEQAQQAGYLSDEYKKLTEVPVAEYQQAVTQMLEKGVADLGLTNNTASESMDTLTGSIAMAQGAWQNWLTELGKDEADMPARTQELVEAIAAAAGNIVPKVIEIGGQLIASVPELVGQVVEAAKSTLLPKLDEITGGAASKFFETFEKIATVVGNAIGKIMEHLAPLIEKLGPVLTDVILPALGVAFDILGAAINVVADIISGFLDLINGVIEAVQNASKVVSDFFNGDGGKYMSKSVPSAKPFATGGVVTAPTNALIGEAGPEAVVPLNSEGISRFAEGIGLTGGNKTNINVTVQARTDDPYEIGREVGDAAMYEMYLQGGGIV